MQILTTKLNIMIYVSFSLIVGFQLNLVAALFKFNFYHRSVFPMSTCSFSINIILLLPLNADLWSVNLIVLNFIAWQWNGSKPTCTPPGSWKRVSGLEQHMPTRNVLYSSCQKTHSLLKLRSLLTHLWSKPPTIWIHLLIITLKTKFLSKHLTYNTDITS